MIDLLIEYATTHGLVVEPGFAPKSARFALQFDQAGKYLGPLLVDRSFTRAPELSFSDLKSLKGNGAHFLIDTAQVVALMHAPGDGEAELTKARAKHDSFVGLLKQAAVLLPELAPVAEALVNEELLVTMRAGLVDSKARPTDKVTLVIGNEFPVESTAWYEWWRKYKKSFGPPEGVEQNPGTKMVCFATGEVVIPAATHPKITGLSDVGGMGVGSPLIGFDKDAFLSYGLEQSANSAISELAASAYRAALNHLIAHQSVRLASAKVLFWYSRSSEVDDDPLRELFDGEDYKLAEEASANIAAATEMRSLRTGERGHLVDRQYYSLLLSGAAGRVMIRDWDTGQFGTLRQNVDSWFADLKIVSRDGNGYARKPKIIGLLAALVRDISDIPAPQVALIWRVATRGLPFPRQIMAAALNRLKIDIVVNSSFNHALLGVLRAYNVRQGDKHLNPSLNPDHQSPAYQCGRLMAIFAAIQRQAIKDIGADVIQRFYAAASTTPAIVVARLTRTCQFHLGKIQQDSPGLAYWYEGRIADVMSKIQGQFPKTLSLEQQSLFALGYYQQIAADRAPKSADVAVSESANSNTKED